MTGKKIYILFLAVTVSLILFIPAALAAVNYESYRVQPGDSLWIISRKFNTTISTIKSVNQLSSDQIYPGQILQVPGTSTVPAAPSAPPAAGNTTETAQYVVKPGDSLFLIGQKFGLSVSKVVELNGLTSTEIYPGQVLLVSAASSEAAYTVRAGDSLFLIAQRFGISVETLMTTNRLTSTVLLVGQVLTVPGPGTSGPTVPPPGNSTPPLDSPQPPTDNIQPPADDSQPPVDIPQLPYGGQWGTIPAGVVLYHIQAGENLWTVANRYNTTISAIMTTNHLHTDLVQVNQPLFIPQNSSEAVSIPYPAASQQPGFGELLDWKYASWVLDTYNTAVIKDLATGKSFKVRRLGGSNHADMEPMTAADTDIMKSIYGGQWSWATRAVLVYVDGQVLAASMAGMPHDVQTIYDNNFTGHFDLHFLNSRTHKTNSIDPDHQAMVQKAAGN